MNILTAENLTKSYGIRDLFRDGNFSVNEGEKIGIIGVNGTGKSTLLSILAGKEEADEGRIITMNNLKIGYLPQNPIFEKEDTIETAIMRMHFDTIDPEGLLAEAKSMLRNFDLYEVNQKIEELSGGQKKKVALVSVLLSGADLLILDEPTNHLDSTMALWLEEYLIRFRGAIILVTHDRYFLDRVVTKIVEIDHGAFYSYPGSYSRFVELKAERQNIMISTEKKRQNILRNELKWLMRGARARSTKQKAHIQRIEALQAVKAPEEDQTIQMSSVSSRMGRKTIEVADLKKVYGDRVLFSGFSYTFLKNERIGIIGPNGCGKSTLLKIITRRLEPDEGYVDIGTTLKIAYFSQENEEMDERLKLIEYVREGAEYIKTKDGVITASQMLERFLFDGPKQWTNISSLSGGEKRRLYLLRLLMEAPNVLILDEPTNDLDIATLTILEDYLDEFEGIVITVSHDRYFLDRVVRRIFAFDQNGEISQYEGGYSDYELAEERNSITDTLSAREDLRTVQEETNSEVSVKKSSKETRTHQNKLKFTFKEAQEYKTIDQDIADLESKIEDLDRQILNASRDFVKLNQLMAEKEAAQTKLEEKTERWIYLTDLAERIEEEKQN